MTRYWPEPDALPDRPLTAIVLANLGTPDAPDAPAVKKYLAEFLTDPRIIEKQGLLWKLILNGIILRTRPARSAQKYKLVWTPDGSPLAVHTEKQTKLLQGHYAWQDITHPEFAWGMRYGRPALADVLQALKMKGVTRFLIVPLYPQYSATTTASIMDEVARCMQHWRNLPEIRYIRSYATYDGYIDALAAQVRKHWQRNTGPADKLILSFHGMPVSYTQAGDPYPQECRATAEALAARLGLPPEKWLLTYQSRFGRAEWLQPYTEPTLIAHAQAGLKSVDILCPGFVSDCLETLEEIAIGCKESFLRAGGETFNYIPCLNERDDWIAALSRLTLDHLGDWRHAPD